MAHIQSIGASFFTDLSVCYPTAQPTLSTLVDKATFDAVFAGLAIESNGGTKGANTFVRVKNVREFPEFGVPPNIVNVPVYGQASTQQVQGQADSPQLVITVNYVSIDWVTPAHLGDILVSGTTYAWRFALMNAEPTSYASTAGGMGTKQNTYWYFLARMDSLIVTPSLTDATTAQVALTLQSKLYGPYTI
jgi:hypothetical protein